MDVIPSFYGGTRAAGELNGYDDAFGNDLLRVGEVKRVVYPEDPGSRTKKFVEYSVLVQHRANGTAVTKQYDNCLSINSLAGLADYQFALLRADTPQPGPSADEAAVQLGYGSKVLLLCINGASAEPVIVGGIRDERQSDLGRRDRGVHLDWEYNGVHVSVADDGSWSVERRGPTTPKGEFDAARGQDATNGTKVAVAADGSFSVRTQDDNQVVVVDHAAKTITVTADQDLTVHGQTIHIGAGAGEKAVLGDTLVKLLGQLIDLIAVQQHPTAVGPSGPPLNAPAFQALKPQLQTALSQFITVKATP